MYNEGSIDFPYIAVSSVSTTYLVICVILFFLYSSREKYKLTNALRDQYTEKQIEYYKALLNQDEDIRKFRHDIKNHMICIQELLNTNNIDNVREYINGLYDTIEKNTAVYDTGNDILNAIINYYSNLCKDKDIVLMINGGIRTECKISAMHLCTIASNILSNAYEATLKADEELKKIIQVHIQCGTKFFEFSVNNPTEINRAKITKEIETTKADKKNHGFGIQNIEDIASQYDGDFQLLDYGDNVTAKVIMRIN